ncbi:NAD-dependent epimerase/dehydratase family protein [Granulicoccus phenolivorans]|uniref:NAD-dependent epimerase/dehydratase family protein n=1 Tax=Granulicoccus phenolivorans TaxID=266854 RepID=UPI0003FC7944|nr:NAD-dependent epimerase/dehydratase family protein [Granulicoccus phenolivorans]
MVLVTGVAQDLGARVARALAAGGDLTVIGLDLIPPRHELGGGEYVHADERSAILPRLMADRGVDTVVHLGLASAALGRAAAKEANVIGTMQLVAATQSSPMFRKLVIGSDAAVYGAYGQAPARFTESTPLRAADAAGLARDLIEREQYGAALASRRHDVVVTTLRLAELIGAGVTTALTRILTQSVVPRPMGFNPRLQFLHPADAVRALTAVIREDHPGVFNVAADDVLSVSQVLSILGRPGVGLPPSLRPIGDFFGGRNAVKVNNDQLALLTYGRVMDITRFTATTGVRPQYSSRRAVEEFAAFGEPGMLSSHRVDALIEQVAHVLSPRNARG